MPQIVTLPGTRDGPDTIFAQQDLTTNATREIPAGGRAYSSLQVLYWTDHSFASIVNSGRIWNISPSNVGTTIAGWNLDVVENFGLIVSEAPHGNAWAVSVGSRGSFVNNAGQIFAIANGNATGISHWDPFVRIVNSGMIAAYAPTASGAGVGDALGVGMFNGGLLDNRAGASILAEGLSATAVIFSRGHLIDPGVAEIRNAGRIEAYAIDAASESVAILSAALTVELMRVVNSGIIRAEIAYRSTSELGYSPPQQPADDILNLAGGEIHGLIDTRLGADRLVNRGLVRGDLLMGEGDDFVDSVGGVLDGKAVMGWGDDRFLGSAGANAVLGGRDGDWLDGGAGNDLLLGGLGDDTLIGGAGNDGLFGEYGEDRIVAGGGDSVDAGAGDDVIEIGDLRFRSIGGGAGLDRLVLAMGADSLDAAAVRATGRLTDIEIIEMRGQQRLVLRAGDVLGLSGEDTLRLLTTASDRVELIGAWKEISAVVADGLICRRFTLAGEITLVGGAGIVTVAAAPSAPAGGLDAVAPGTAAPLPGAVPGIVPSSVTTVLNNYMLHDTEIVQAYEIWRSDGGQPVLWTFGWDFSLINHGLIESIGPGNGGAKAMIIDSLDRVENHGTIRARASGDSYADAIFGLSHGGLTNYGLIEAITEAGWATGVRINGAVWDAFNFLNLGTISARTNGAAKAIGAILLYDDDAFNYGSITALGGDGTTGVQLLDQRRFTNYGTITADLAAGASGGTTGFAYRASAWGSTYFNYGLIHGAKAIEGDEYFGVAARADFYNFGRIEGSIGLAGGDGRFENWGSIVGDARLGAGRNLWFGGGGEHLGQVFGGDGSDMLVGGAAADRLNGDGGDDYLHGGAGADRLSGGAGKDRFVYTSVGDSRGSIIDTITDFVSGTDRIDLTALAVQSVSIQAGAGFNLLTATTAAGTLTVRVNNALAQSDLILATAPTVTGTSGADVLFATAGGSVLNAGVGEDVLIGAAGNDRLKGGVGNDLFWGGKGDDVYVVNDPGDLVWEVTGEGIDRIELDAPGMLLELPDNVENVTMIQSAFVRGNDLANTIRGSAGEDFIAGGGGDDLLDGGAGNDRLEGGAGTDRMTGGAGADIFSFLSVGDSAPPARRSDGRKFAPDLITDFTSGTDKIRLEDIDAIEGGDPFDAFTFIGTNAFSSHAGEVRYEISGGRAHIYADVDGNGIADMHLIAVTTILVASDFIL